MAMSEEEIDVMLGRDIYGSKKDVVDKCGDGSSEI